MFPANNRADDTRNKNQGFSGLFEVDHEGEPLGGAWATYGTGSLGRSPREPRPGSSRSGVPQPPSPKSGAAKVELATALIAIAEGMFKGALIEERQAQRTQEGAPADGLRHARSVGQL